MVLFFNILYSHFDDGRWIPAAINSPQGADFVVNFKFLNRRGVGVFAGGGSHVSAGVGVFAGSGGRSRFGGGWWSRYVEGCWSRFGGGWWSRFGGWWWSRFGGG